MSWIDWLILLVPLAAILWLAFYCRNFVRGVVDFLAAGRVAGRYVISVGDMQTSLCVAYLVASCESQYQCGLGMHFWNNMVIPVSIFLALTGFVVYRYRETRCMSMGQFLEMRYSHGFRVVAAFIRTTAEMLVNAITPAVTARFFIYFLGLPPSFQLGGITVSTFGTLLVIILALALFVIWQGGRISLLVTDAIQGLLSYPIFLVFIIFIFVNISWSQDIVPILSERMSGESFINPMDVQSLRDFNLFGLFVTIVSMVVGRGAWIGNDTSGAGRTAHEQKMAGILGAWRNGFYFTMMVMIVLFTITMMNVGKFAPKAAEVRTYLINKAANETLPDASVRSAIQEKLPAVNAADYPAKPYSRNHNPDLSYLDMVRASMPDTPEDRSHFQGFRTIYYQMMMPSLLRHALPAGLMGLFALLMVMMMVSTDDSRIFNSSASLVQDVVMPLKKRPFTKREHLTWLRIMSLLVGGLFLVASLLMTQMDFLTLFINIMCSLWVGAAGPIMLGGLYSRRGNTAGAYCALIFGSGMALFGIFLQYQWSSMVYPWLESCGLLPYVDRMFQAVTGVCSPYIVWQMDATKFPINSYEISFIAMVLGFAAYFAASLLTCRKPFNLERMLHRDGGQPVNVEKWYSRSNFYKTLIGITPECTRGDRIIMWSVFVYSIVYQFLLSFLLILALNICGVWKPEWWSWYFFVNVVLVEVLIGVISMVWFSIGGVKDMRRLFKDLAARVDDPEDDGRVIHEAEQETEQ